MTSRALLIALLLLAGPLAGCLGGDAPDPPSEAQPSDPQEEDGRQAGDRATSGRDEPAPAPRPPRPFFLQGRDCHDVTASVPVASQAASAHLPEGFTPEAYLAGPGLPADPGLAVLSAWTILCPAGGLSSAGGGWGLHLLALQVRPPEPLQAPRTQSELVVLGGITDDEALAAAFQDRGWPVVTGQVRLEVTEPPADPFGVLGPLALQAEAQGGNASTTFAGAARGENTTGQPGVHRIWHDAAARLEYLHVGIATARLLQNATGTLASQDPEGLLGQLAGPASPADATLGGPYRLLASPLVVQLAGS